MAGVTRAGAVPFYTCEDLGSISSTQRRHLLHNFQNLLSIFLKLGNIRSFPFTLAFSASQDLAARALQSHCQVLDDIKGTEFRQGSVSAILGHSLPTVMDVVSLLPFLLPPFLFSPSFSFFPSFLIFETRTSHLS